MGSPRGDDRPVPVHRLRPNETVWTPPCVIFLDSESRWRTDGGDEYHTLRLWAACRVDRRNVRKTDGPVLWGHGDTAVELGAWLTARTKGRDSVWLYAHNLNFDLVTTNLVETLGGFGWQVTDFAVSGQAPWLRLRRGGRVLTVVDSWSWLPESLESLATRMGSRKVTLPDNGAGVPEWAQRCATDVELLGRSVLALMSWWDENRLGRWTISGAGCGWNAMRHTATVERHVIDIDPALVAQDRLAVRGGRKDATVVRSATGGPWVEIDLEGAYPTVARELPLPLRRAWTFDRLDVDSKWIGHRLFGVIAEATVCTDRPRYPVRHDGVTWYPVGQFKTVLAGPELAWARDSGHLVSVGPGQAHQLGHALRPWACWVLDPSRGGTVEVPPVAQLAVKGWGRSVLGKFAARSHSSELLEGPEVPGWAVGEMWDARTRVRGAEVSMGGRRWLVSYDQNGENCYPAVLAFVESEVRVRLGKVLEALDGAWWTADTDGLLVDMEIVTQWVKWGTLRLGRRPRSGWGMAQALCDWLAPQVAPLTLRPKREVSSLSVLGPQHLTVGDERRMSGVRKDAVEDEPGRFVARDWPGLSWQMNHSSPGVYRRPIRVSTFRTPTVHRWTLSDGLTAPVRFGIGTDGQNRILPFAMTAEARSGASLAEAQYPRLARVDC